jgi:hypothetical protein
MTTDHLAMNRLIRAAAGRRHPVPEPAVDRVGDAGIGRGGGATRRLDTDPHGAINEQIRSALAAKRLLAVDTSNLFN